MEAFFTTANPQPAALAIELINLEAVLQLPGSTNALTSQGSDTKVRIQDIDSQSDAFVTLLDGVVADLTSLQTLDSHLSGYSEGDAGLYTALKTSADSAETSAASALVILSNIQSSQGTTWDAADDILSALPRLRIQIQVIVFEGRCMAQ